MLFTSWLKSGNHKAQKARKAREQQRALRDRALRLWRPTRLNLEPLEDRVAPAIDTIFDVPNATYLLAPTVNNVLDDFQTGLVSVENAVVQANALAGFANQLNLAIPGLLNRTGADPTAYAAPQLASLLDGGGLTDVRVRVGARLAGDPFTVLVACGTKPKAKGRRARARARAKG